MDALNNRASKIHKEKNDRTERIEKSIVMVDFNTHFLMLEQVDRKSVWIWKTQTHYQPT